MTGRTPADLAKSFAESHKDAPDGRNTLKVSDAAFSMILMSDAAFSMILTWKCDYDLGRHSEGDP